jgi:hypothetical protein
MMVIANRRQSVDIFYNSYRPSQNRFTINFLTRIHLKNTIVIADFDPRSRGSASETGFRLGGRNDKLLIGIFEIVLIILKPASYIQ